MKSITNEKSYSATNETEFNILLVTYYYISCCCITKQQTDCKKSQGNRSSTDELGAWKVEIDWNNCLLQWRICYKYYGYFQQNPFADSTIASHSQSLFYFRLMWNHDILTSGKFLLCKWGSSGEIHRSPAQIWRPGTGMSFPI